MKKTIGYAAHDYKSQLAPFSFERRNPLPTDIQIEILFCGNGVRNLIIGMLSKPAVA